MEINYEMQEKYVGLINSLFGGAVRAEPDQINEEVITYINKMYTEIADCHMTLGAFAVPFLTIGKIMDDLIPAELKFIFGDMTFQEYVEDKTMGALVGALEGLISGSTVIPPSAKSLNAVVDKKGLALDFFAALIETWLDYTEGNRQLVMCINVARVNWRSKVQMALMGL